MNLIQPVLVCLLLCVCYVWANNESINPCCPPGQPTRMRSFVCLDTKTNLTSPLSISCTAYVPFSDFSFTDDQKLILSLGNSKEIMDKFCTGTLRSTGHLYALVCADEDTAILDDKILGYCMIVSLLFLIPTALVYSGIKELRDVQGKSIINLCISLAIAQGVIVMLKLMDYSDMTLCAIRGFLGYFFLITAFFWTNAISIQILLNMKRPSTMDYTWHEFKWYFIYAWGVPTVLTTCMAIVNYVPGDHNKPGIGVNHCWFFSTREQWYWMYSVMCLLLLVNIGIFIYVALMICRLTFSSNHLKTLRFKLVMTTRLIVLMGLPWVFEMIGSLAGQHIIWTIIDVFNCLQGILIFLLLVVFRRRVIKLMYNHGWLNCISGVIEKHLAFEDDEENVVQHTDVPMSMTEAR